MTGVEKQEGPGCGSRDLGLLRLEVGAVLCGVGPIAGGGVGGMQDGRKIVGEPACVWVGHGL